MSAARESYLARQRAVGNSRDPFAEEERRQAKRLEQQPRTPDAQAAALHAAQQQQHGGAAAAHAPALLPAGGVQFTPVGGWGKPQGGPMGIAALAQLPLRALSSSW